MGLVYRFLKKHATMCAKGGFSYDSPFFISKIKLFLGKMIRFLFVRYICLYESRKALSNEKTRQKETGHH